MVYIQSCLEDICKGIIIHIVCFIRSYLVLFPYNLACGKDKKSLTNFFLLSEKSCTSAAVCLYIFSQHALFDTVGGRGYCSLCVSIGCQINIAHLYFVIVLKVFLLCMIVSLDL
jgi:hypothetical protein